MQRKELEDKGLTKEQVDFIMAEYGKSLKAEQDKAKAAQDTAVKEAADTATKPLTDKLAAMEKQAAEYEEKLKGIKGIDEKSKAEIAELQKAHAEKLKELETKQTETKKAHENELLKLKREAETREFMSALPKKFITPETQKAFEERINEALTDKAYEGRNRADILSIITKDQDGKERADIYASDTTAKVTATGGTGTPPNGGNDETPKSIPTFF